MKKWFYRRLARAPLLIYRWGLEWLFGKRLIRLHHQGRRSGLLREVVLEVIRVDSQRLIVASGWGKKAQWYRNLLKNPQAQVDFDGERFWIYAIPISQRQGQEELHRYEQNHPWLSWLLQRLLGPGVWRDVRLMRLEREIQPVK